MGGSFDPAFCMDMPKPDRGIAAGIIRTAEELTDWQTPIVPIMMNLYFAPQPTAMRCYQFGRAVREVINEYPADLRVGVIGSGGLWHTPRQKGAWLNEAFDRQMLAYLRAGDARSMAEYFDSYVVPVDDPSQDIKTVRPQVTGMPAIAGGPQFGSRETCAWISAAAVSEGRPATIVDYIPVYASPVGNAFAYCDQI
jgi:Catalytic LigB subunit of aromatic ring-opening dioxygenase